MMVKSKQKYIIGIDEVGRGALAGPVVAAALALPLKSNIKNQISKIQIKNQKLKDSKKLSPKQREIWFKWIKQHSNILQNIRMFYAVVSVSPKIIDKINVSQAANLAATRALARLLATRKLATSNLKVFLDGGLYLNIKTLVASGYRLKSKTIIKGDEKIPAISLASIVAKVSRDRKMVKLHKKYSQYGFNKHKGYGTKQHIAAIKKHGQSKIHRLTFLRKIS